MNEIVLHNAEYRLCNIVWDNEPLKSAQLSVLAEQELGWKKTTTYTVLRKLMNRGILQNEDTIVTALVKREQAQKSQGEALLNRVFDGQLSSLFVSFLDGGCKLTEEEAEALHKLIEEAKGRE